jgi:tRNA(Ile)-lysidine synthase
VGREALGQEALAQEALAQEALAQEALAQDSQIGALLSRCRFPRAGTAVTCAVSGGADSLALLILARAAGLEATAAHVDHGLRTESAAEVSVVAAAAARLGAGLTSVRLELEDGPNLEARARQARYAALPAGVLTGHTADDQAETVLLNLLRGSGLDGLSGMRPSGPSRPAVPTRPLLGLRRHETAALCQRLGFEPVRDLSNDDPRFLRNRVRHELLPLLGSLSGRDPVPVLCRQANLMAAEAELLDGLAAELDATDARALSAAPPALARRAVRAWLRDGEASHPLPAADIERVLAVARGESAACEISGGQRVARTRGRLRRS